MRDEEQIIFEVEGEGLRKVEGGLETPSGIEPSWEMRRVTRP